jgi:hypothetical protein
MVVMVGFAMIGPGTIDAAPTGSTIVSEPGKHVGLQTSSKPQLSLAAGAVPNGIAGGYVFVPINPFRAIDSRNYPGGFLLGGEAFFFDVVTDDNGTPQIPPEAVAVTYNLAVTGTIGSGYLGIYPADINWPGNASINWGQSDTTLSNGGTVAVGFWTTDAQAEVYCGPAGTSVGTYFVVDITGYYI